MKYADTTAYVNINDDTEALHIRTKRVGKIWYYAPFNRNGIGLDMKEEFPDKNKEMRMA